LREQEWGNTVLPYSTGDGEMEKQPVALFIGGIMMLTTVGIALFSVYMKLRFDTLPNWKVTDALMWLISERKWQWLYFPTDWVGAHSLLSSTPLWALTFALSVAAVIWAAHLE
jgi:hypothetical protein